MKSDAPASEQPTTSHPPVQSNATRNTQHNAQKPGDRYLRSIQLDVPTFDDCLDYSGHSNP